MDVLVVLVTRSHISAFLFVARDCERVSLFGQNNSSCPPVLDEAIVVIKETAVMPMFNFVCVMTYRYLVGYK